MNNFFLPKSSMTFEKSTTGLILIDINILKINIKLLNSLWRVKGSQ